MFKKDKKLKLTFTDHFYSILIAVLQTYIIYSFPIIIFYILSFKITYYLFLVFKSYIISYVE